MAHLKGVAGLVHGVQDARGVRRVAQRFPGDLRPAWSGPGRSADHRQGHGVRRGRGGDGRKAAFQAESGSGWGVRQVARFARVLPEIVQPVPARGPHPLVASVGHRKDRAPAEVVVGEPRFHSNRTGLVRLRGEKVAPVGVKRGRRGHPGSRKDRRGHVGETARTRYAPISGLAREGKDPDRTDRGLIEERSVG